MAGAKVGHFRYIEASIAMLAKFRENWDEIGAEAHRCP